MAEKALTSDLAEAEQVAAVPDSDDASGLTDATEQGGESAPLESSPPSARASSPETTTDEIPEVPAFVITCPNCQSSIPFVPGVEGYEPSMGANFQTCTGCDGFGQVKTGSMVAAHSVVTCTDCDGAGFTTRDGSDVPVEIPPQAPPWEGAKWNTELQTWV